MDFLFENVLVCYLRFNDDKMLELVQCTDFKMDVSYVICGLNALK